MADVIIDEPRADEASRADASSDAESVVFSGVGKVFGGATAALSNVDLSVTRGEVFGIIGRSGAGKSTLLRLVNGLEKPSSGEVRVNGISVGALDERGLVALRRRIGMVFQHFNLLSAKTVRENIALPLKIAGRRSARSKRRSMRCSNSSACRRNAMRIRAVFRADRSSAWASRGRSSTIPTCCSATKRRPRSTPRRRSKSSRCCATSIGGSG